MTTPEQMRELEIEIVKKFSEKIQKVLFEFLGFELYSNIDIENIIIKYLVINNKSPHELNKQDQRNIFADALITALDHLKTLYKATEEPTKIPRKRTEQEWREATDAELSIECADLIAYYENKGPVIPETKRDCKQEVAELETMFTEFELKHNLTELLAIDVMGPKGTPIREQRTLANKDRTVIFTKMKKLKDETDISEEQMSEFIAKYDRINMAVGAIVGDVNIGKLDHSHREVTL